MEQPNPPQAIVETPRQPLMTHKKAQQLIKALGADKAKLYLRAYFRNQQKPTDPATRRLEFARFFFPDAFNESSPAFHVELFGIFGSGHNSGVAAPRGHAKTTVSSAEITYRIVNSLNHHILVISDTYSQAKDIVDNIRSELEGNKMLLWVYGNLATDWHWTSGSFTTANEVRVTARGSNMKVRGLKYRHWRPDYAVTDDLENDELVQNQERRDKLMNWLKKALLPAMARKNSQVCIVGTILHSDSLLNNVITGKSGFAGWQRSRYASLSPDGEALWPDMYSAEDLRRMRDDPNYERYLGPLVFAQEMQNEPVDDSSRIIKREWIYGTAEKPNTYSLTAKEEQYRAEHPDLKWTQAYVDTLVARSLWMKNEITQVLMAVDPAISEKETADYFAAVVLGVDKRGEIWILDIFRDRISDIDVQVAKILELNAQWRPDRVKIEAVAYQAGLAKAVQRQAAAAGQHVPVFAVTPDKDKFRRAVIHSANFAGNLVHLRTDHPLFEQFVMELLEFPKGKNDDMFDAYMHAAEQLVQRIKTRTFARKPAGL